MDIVKFGLLVFVLTLGVFLAKVGLDYADKLLNKKRNKFEELSAEVPLWLDILDTLTGAARVAVSCVEQTTVKKYKEARGAGSKLTAEEQKDAWREAAMLMLAELPQYVLDEIAEKYGPDQEAQIQGLRKYIEADIDARKNP